MSAHADAFLALIRGPGFRPTFDLIYSLKSSFSGDSDSYFPKSKQPEWIYGKINIENNVLV